MVNFDTNKYDKAELQGIYNILKKFRALIKNVGKKSFEILILELSWKQKLVVEYFPSLEKNMVFWLTKDIYKDVFKIDIDETKLIWKENSNLKGWIRLFFGDDMLDVSFLSISNNIRKI